MTTVTVVPRGKMKLYGALVKKEVELRRKNQGTLHRYSSKEAGKEKWIHNSYPGWVRFQRCLGQVVVAQVGAKSAQGETQFLSSFLGFLDRHFRDEIASVMINYD